MHVQFPSTHALYRLQVLYDLLQASWVAAPTVQRYGIVLISDNKEPQQWRMWHMSKVEYVEFFTDLF